MLGLSHGWGKIKGNKRATIYWRKEDKVIFIRDFQLQGPELLERPKVTVLKSKVYTLTHPTGKGKRKFEIVHF